MVAQIVFCFLVGIVLVWPLGVGSYFLLRWLRRIKPSWLVFVDYLLAFLSISFGPALVFVIPLCLGASYATRSMEGRDKASFYDFVKALSASNFPVLAVTLIIVYIALMFPAFYDSLTASINESLNPLLVHMSEGSFMAFYYGAYIGATASPSLIPILAWDRSGSKIRPALIALLRKADFLI